MNILQRLFKKNKEISRKKLIIKTIIVFFIVSVASAVFINFSVKRQSRDHIYYLSKDVPPAQAVMILGAKVYSGGRLSDILRDRTETALEIYDSGVASKIIVSGDHGQAEYDEVNAVKDFLLDQGVQAEDIFLDHAGFDTYDSLYRARAVFQIKSLIISTQEFHQPRAVYIARKLGIDATGIVADKHRYVMARFNSTREFLARIKAWGNVLVHSKPKFLGPEISIEGDGRESWD